MKLVSKQNFFTIYVLAFFFKEVMEATEKTNRGNVMNK